MKNITNWLGYHFSTGGETGDDYLNFQRAARTDLKKKAAAAGFGIREISHDFPPFNELFCVNGLLWRDRSFQFNKKTALPFEKREKPFSTVLLMIPNKKFVFMFACIVPQR